MFGIKIAKTQRTNGAWVWPSGFQYLDELLRPVRDELRSLWWATARTEYCYPAAWLLEVRDRRVVRMQTFTDRDKALEAAGLSE